MIRGRHRSHSSGPAALVPRRAPLSLNVAVECLGCGAQFVVFVPAGVLLTCGDCGASNGVDCPRCGELAAFEAAPIGNEPVLLMTFDSEGRTVELP